MSRSTNTSSFFSTSGTDKILTKDTTKVDGTSPNTSIADILVGLKDDTVKAIRNTPAIAREVADLAVQAKAGKLNKADALLRVGSVLGGSAGPLTNMSVAARDKIFDTLGIGADRKGEILSAVGDVVTLSRSNDVTGANSLARMMKSVTGSKGIAQLFDLQAEAAVLGGLMGEAIRLGVPSAVDDLMKSAKTVDIRYAMASDNLYLAVASSDINTMTTLVTTLGPETVRAKYPSFVPDFLKGYRFPLKTTMADYPTIMAQLLALFVAVDPRWDLDLVGKEWWPSISPFVEISADAQTLFKSTPTHRNQVMLATGMTEVKISDWIRDKFKYFPL